MKQPEIKMTYKSLMSFEMQTLLAKLISTPTSNKNASHINHIFQQISKCGDQIREEFRSTILDQFALKGEDGKIVVNEGGFEPDPSRLEEYQKALAEFEKGECVVKWQPLRPSHLSDVKVSAKEIDVLGGLFTEEEGPGVPGLTLA